MEEFKVYLKKDQSSRKSWWGESNTIGNLWGENELPTKISPQIEEGPF